MEAILSFFHALFPDLDSDILLINTILSVIFILIAIISFFVILASRLVKWLANEPKIIKEANDYIVSELYNEDGDKKTQRKLYAKKQLRNNFIIQVYINQCVELHRSLSGEVAEELRVLFEDLNLSKYVSRQFNSFDWSTKANAISVLSEMDNKDSYKSIIGFVNHYKITLRYKAQVAAVALANENHFDFLDLVKKPINSWQQLQILNAAINLQNAQLPDFGRWFNHKEPSVIVLAIKLATHFTQFQLSDAITEKCSDKNTEISLTALKAVRHMQIFTAKDVLIKLYPTYNIDEQIEVLKILPNIASTEIIPFLESVIENNQFQQKLLAIEALFLLGIEKTVIQEKLHNNDAQVNEQNVLMVNHVLENKAL